MKRIVLAVFILAASALLTPISVLADPAQEQDQGSAMILDCAKKPTPGVISPCAKMYDYISSTGWKFTLDNAHGSGICAALASTDVIRGVTNAVKYVEAQGFSYMESVALVIQLAQMDCPNSYGQLVTWANTPWSLRGMA